MKSHLCSSVSICGYKFPDSAKFDRVISKSKIYKHAAPTSKVKELFVAQVEKITWAYKLSPTTINLPASDGVQEIQVFTVSLRTGELSFEVLQTIDKAIPSPILFVLSYNEKCRYAAAYKRLSEADKSRWVVSRYFQSADYADERRLGKKELPLVLNMGALYEALLKELIPLRIRDNESFQMLVVRAEQVQKLEREAVKLANRIKKEKQFNRRVELNRTLNELKQEIEDLKDE